MEKKLFYILAGTSLFFSMMSGCMSCRTYTLNNNASTTQKKVNDSLVSVINNMNQNMYNKKQIGLLFERNMYQISKEVVYTNNAIVRTATRPDDVIKSYDDNINKIDQELKKLEK